jgi:hypothetical protein
MNQPTPQCSTCQYWLGGFGAPPIAAVCALRGINTAPIYHCDRYEHWIACTTATPTR